MFIKEIILICYMLGILLGVSGFTVALLVRKKKKSDLNKAFICFFAGLLVICFYDMAIYYCDYVIGVFSNMRVLRIGNCIIAGTMYLWVALQAQIIKRESLVLMDGLVKKYLLFYMAMWLLLTFFLSTEQMYTLKWLLLVTDVILIISFTASAVGHIIYAAVANDKSSLYYMVVVTAMLLWNYVSYFWGETSVYWGNSQFIRAPLDLTIIFWLIINAANLYSEYKMDFTPTFGKNAVNGSGRSDIPARIEEVCTSYKLTPREKEFVELIYSGKSNREIAELLFLSESTVKTHIYNIFRKMNVKNRVSVICIINGETEERTEPDGNQANEQ